MSFKIDGDTGNVTATNLSGTNTGDVTIGTANGLTLSSQAISMTAASTSATGVLTTGSQSIAGAKTFITASPMKGAAAGSTAAAGNVGEVLSSVSSLANIGTTAQRFDVTSLSLPAGNWVVFCVTYYTKNAATLTAGSGWEIGLSTTTGNSTTGLTLGDNYLSNSWPDVSNVTEMSMALPGMVVSPSSTTTYFLKGRGVYSAGTPQCIGRIRAVRLP